MVVALCSRSPDLFCFSSSSAASVIIFTLLCKRVLGCMVCREMQNAQVTNPIVQEDGIKKKRKKTERRKRVEGGCYIEGRLRKPK